MGTYDFDHTTMENDNVVNIMEYAPNGTDHRFQRRVTELMDRVVQADKRFTLAELGYLHINTLTYDKQTGSVCLKVYFDLHYVSRTVKNKVNNSSSIVPVQELNVFQNYLFVGPLTGAVSYETILAPKSKMTEDEMGRASIRFKDDAKLVDTDCLVLNCNLPITVAAMHDINLMDPLFKIKCTTVGMSHKNQKKNIIASGSKRYVPVALTVRAGAIDNDDGESVGYDPSEAVGYLTALRERTVAANENKKKLADKARDKAEKTTKKTSSSRLFDKYS